MNNYVVCFTAGGSGHFLGHFLHTEFLDTEAGIKVDGWKTPKDTFLLNSAFDKLKAELPYDYITYDPISKYTNIRSLFESGMTSFDLSEHCAKINPGKQIIRITHSNLQEQFRMSFNHAFKNREQWDLKFHSLQWIMDCFYVSIFDEFKTNDTPDRWDEFSPKPWAINISYNEIFNLYSLIQLYYTVHNSVCPDHKIKYAQSYIEQNVSIFNKWEFRAMEKIFMYEYENSLEEFAGGKLRNWSVDDITEENWQTFLDEHLCLTKYH